MARAGVTGAIEMALIKFARVIEIDQAMVPGLDRRDSNISKIKVI
jgi:hypothetical protein